MDTTTVNFAINKLTEGWHAVAPSIRDVGEKYVHYVVFKELLGAVMALICLLLLGVAFVVAVKKSIATKDANICAPVVLFGGALTLVVTAVFLVQAHGAALAYFNPEMFTVSQLLNEAKAR